jgi:syntaxin 5
LLNPLIRVPSHTLLYTRFLFLSAPGNPDPVHTSSLPSVAIRNAEPRSERLIAPTADLVLGLSAPCCHGGGLNPGPHERVQVRPHPGAEAPGLVESWSAETVPPHRLAEGRCKHRHKWRCEAKKVGVCAKGGGDRQRHSSDHGEAGKVGTTYASSTPPFARSSLTVAATVAKRKTLFDDRPVEINELTFIIKQDLSSLNQQISSLQSLSRAQHPKADQEGEHNKNVVFLLQGKLTDVSANFKDVLEVRTKNIQASRSRTENFVSSVSAHTAPSLPQGSSPLYSTPARGSPGPGQDLLSLNPVGDQQLLAMEEAQPQNTYIHQRGEAIEAIERTISELGGIFGQLATMVSEQSEMIQRIDANTEDVVDNVQGAQRELLKYWSRVSGNRWLIARMFGVLMIFFL